MRRVCGFQGCVVGRVQPIATGGVKQGHGLHVKHHLVEMGKRGGGGGS